MLQVTSYGIDERDEVHELEFLSLLAFLARESISSRRMNLSKAKKFSPNDLEMAYAFHKQHGKGAVPNKPPMQLGGSSSFEGHQKHQVPPPRPHYRLDTSPQHVLNASGQQHQGMLSSGQQHQGTLSSGQQHQDTLSSGHGHMQLGQSGFHSQMATREYQGHGESFGEQQLQNRHELSPGHSMLHQSARYSGQTFGGGPAGHSQQDRDEQRMTMLLAANERQPPPIPHDHYPGQQGMGMMASPEHDKKTMPMQLYPSGDHERQPHPPQGGGERVMLDASRSSGDWA